MFVIDREESLQNCRKIRNDKTKHVTYYHIEMIAE